MKLSRDAIEEFKKIYHEEFGANLSDAEALEMGQRLLSLFEILSRPLAPSSSESQREKPPVH